MTDPTPTRAEVDIARFDPCPFGGAMTIDPSGDYVRHDDYADLRERAEAAEQERDALLLAVDLLANEPPKQRDKRIAKELTEARRAEAAAWNDAIEAAASVYLNGSSPNTWDYFSLARHEIRALRRAAPTGGEA